MFIRNLTFRPTVAHNLFLAVLLISIISIASAASDGAVFSFSDPFREFLGIQSPPVASIAANRIATKRPAGGSWLLSEQNSAAFLAPCDTPFANEIVEENCKTGNPALEWDISGAGDSSIQGFATDISVNRGGTISFKVDTDASSIQIKIYRLGYYNGDGARLIATIPDTSTTVSAQPACTNSGAPDYLIDCGGWSVSGSWTATDDTYAPSKPAVSGLYVARLERTDSTNGSSHIPFIVRDDTGGSDLLFKTSDTTWQAYNQYGGYSLYAGPAIPNGGHAHKVSYNRPFTTRDTRWKIIPSTLSIR
ncbi:MAG: hypothetical protein IPI76_16800 [Chloracidobacterium sp.]|nr:hypothetical protein [Chloracidobacterium sp.]MBK9768485.1 hypothetical protein [Chloracidobacterium sp.]